MNHDQSNSSFSEHDTVLADLVDGANRDLARRRHRTMRRGLGLMIVSVAVLMAGVSAAAPGGALHNLFAPDVTAEQQLPGLSQLGRPLRAGPEDEAIRMAYQELDGNGNVPASDIPPVKDARVLIDRGPEFQLVAVTARGKHGGLCIAASIDAQPLPSKDEAAKATHPTYVGMTDANCQGQIIFEQPFTSTTTQSSLDNPTWITYGVVADGVHDITFKTDQRTLKIATENRAYYWKARPHEEIREMSAIRPDGSIYRYKTPPGTYDLEAPPSRP